jgi:predicted ATPase/DNA-binding winged helix-turn-helix (wHTH) protein
MSQRGGMASGYHFGRVEIRPVERQVLVDGELAPLHGKAFDMLLALVERRDRTVTRAELHDLVWQGRVVEDNNLDVQVHALRKRLGAKTIVTIPGRGYRFTLAEQPLPAESETGARPLSDERLEDEQFLSPSTSARSPRTSLPAPLSTLFGRDDDLAALKHLLEEHRLLSVIGAGGIGKSVFALAAAHAQHAAQRDGTIWVELAQVLDPALLASTVAQALGLPAAGGADPLRALAAGLESTQALLVLDNAEHLVESVANLAAAVWARAPGMRLLVTSQVALKVDGERVFRLGALAVPEAGTTAAQALDYGAVALFVDQAQAADRRFALADTNVATVIDLCRHLDGVALAIKLAAARLPLLGLHGLQERLAERLKVIGGGLRTAPTRQQTLRAALDWSYSLLSDDEQIVFRRLGVFVGGFTLELAVAVAQNERYDEAGVIEMLAALVDRSLVVADDGDPPRYRLLESAREYALLRLDEAGESATVMQRHARVFATWMARQEKSFWVTPDAAWLPSVSRELDNMRVALDWSGAHDGTTALALGAPASRLFGTAGLIAELNRRLASLEPLLAPDTPAPIAAKYWVNRAMTQPGFDFGRMHDFAAKAETLYRKLDDPGGLYFALCMKGWSGRVPVTESGRLVQQTLALEQLGLPPRLIAMGRLGQGMLHYAERQYAVAGRDFDVASVHARACGATRADAIAACFRVMVHYVMREVDEGVRLCRQVVGQERRRFGFLALASGYLAFGLVLQGELGQARQALTELFRLCRASDWDLFDTWDEAYLLLALQEARQETAARLLGYHDRAGRPPGARALALEEVTRARSTLKAAFDAPNLQRLLAEGAQLDQEAVCALTLESASVAPRPAGMGADAARQFGADSTAPGGA